MAEVAPLIELAPEVAEGVAELTLIIGDAADEVGAELIKIFPPLPLPLFHRNATNTGNAPGRSAADDAVREQRLHDAAQKNWNDLYTEWNLIATTAAAVANLRDIVDGDALAAQNAENILETIERADANQLQNDIQQLASEVSFDVQALSDNINLVQANATAEADQAQQNSVNFALQGLTQLQDALTQDINQVQANATALADAAQQNSVGYTDAVAGVLEQFTVQVGQQVQNAAQAGDVAVQGQIGPTAQALDQQKEIELGIASQGAMANPWGQLMENLGNIDKVVNPGTVGKIALEGLIAQGLASDLPGQLGQIAQAIQSVAQGVDDCAVPTCENLGGLSNLFKDLLTDLFWIALAAFLAQCFFDPSAAADEVASIGSDVTGIFNGTLSLLGIS